MPELAEIEKQLRKVDVLASSIPHFLHWDVAYLWMLECQPSERTGVWTERIQAWKRLVAMLLLGKLELKTSGKLRERPFAEFAERLGIEEVTWAYAPGGSEPLGVLSPTVLVRSLPDFNPKEDLEHWPRDPNEDPGLRPMVHHFVAQAIKRLSAETREEIRPAAERLAGILGAHFPNAKPGATLPAVSILFGLLKRIQWVPGKLGTESVSLLVYSHRKAAYIPICDRCSKPVTHAEKDAALRVTVTAQMENGKSTPVAVVTCPKCARETRLELNRLMIWPRGKQVVIWEDRYCKGSPTSKGGAEKVEEVYPPRAAIDGASKTVAFEWTEGEAGEKDRRFLKLGFQDREILEITFDHVCFRTLLVLSPKEKFTGLPVRPEWRDLVENCEGPKWVGNDAQYFVKFHGWPFGFNYSWLSPKEAPHMLLGVYPGFIPGWKTYRVFVVGERHQDYRVCSRSDGDADGRRMPWCLVQEAWPRHVAIVEKGDQSIGTTVDIEPAPSVRVDQQAKLFLGIDFGTTNSLAYFGNEDDVGDLKPEDHAIQPARLFDAAKPIVGSWHEASQHMEGSWFLPSKSTATASEGGAYLIPSAFWAGGGFPVIRWTDVAPYSLATAKHGFKWDSSTEDFRGDREDYLKELLFLLVPYAIHKKVKGMGVALEVGWAFPLAFDYTARKKMLNLVGSLKTWMNESMGLLSVEHYSINESRANVRGFGRPQAGQTYLVADMGGGTLDLALFTYLGREGTVLKFDYHQMGSIRFGGESFVYSVIRRQGADAEKEYWRYRDGVTSATPASPWHGNQLAENMLKQFAAMALEFLRTMYLAFARGQDQTVRLALAGNGWRLIEAISSATPQHGPHVVFDAFYSAPCKKMGLPGFGLYADPAGPPLTKHYVAQGALLNAVDRDKELEHTASPMSKLPAGRNIEFCYGPERNEKTERVNWDRLVGEARECWFDDDGATLTSKRITTDLESGPPQPQPWNQYWQSTVGNTGVPTEEKIRDWICQHLQGNDHWLRKGPLQLLMENYWLEYLRTRK